MSHARNATTFGILNDTNVTHSRRNTLHVAQRFELFLNSYRRPDGSLWTGQKLDEATGGVVPRSYFTNLGKGCIENPGYEKMLAIARAMGSPIVVIGVGRYTVGCDNGAPWHLTGGHDLGPRVSLAEARKWSWRPRQAAESLGV